MYLIKRVRLLRKNISQKTSLMFEGLVRGSRGPRHRREGVPDTDGAECGEEHLRHDLLLDRRLNCVN